MLRVFLFDPCSLMRENLLVIMGDTMDGSAGQMGRGSRKEE